jgi:trypsin
MFLKTSLVALALCIGLVAHSEPGFSEKIVGGIPAYKGELPFQVSLQSRAGTHFCGGSLIKRNWVLTAAHCVQSSTPIQVVVGLYDQKNNEDVETFSTLKIVSHPKFNGMSLDFDYALIELSGDSKYRPINLNRVEPGVASENDPFMVWTSGWGTTSESSSMLPNILQKVEIPLVSTTTCNATQAYNGIITARMLCAGLRMGGKNSCQGDSGGPLFTRQANGDYNLIGVVSWGEGCARPDKYGVFSKVNVVLDWIEKQTQ